MAAITRALLALLVAATAIALSGCGNRSVADMGKVINPPGQSSPTRLALATPAAGTVSQCIAGFVLTAQNDSGFAAPVSADTTVSFAGFGSGSFFSDSSCATPVTAITLAAGTSSAQLYFRDTKIETLTLSASASGLTAASATFAVTSTPPTGISLGGFPIAAPGNCTGPYAVMALDSGGSVIDVTTATPISLSGQGHGQFYSDSSCGSPITGGSVTIAPNTSTALFYLLDNTAETLDLQAAAPGLGSASLTVTVEGNGATRLVFTGPTSASAGSCTALQVGGENLNGNPTPVVATTAVSLASTGTGAFYSDSGCTTATASFSLAAGALSQTIYFRDTTAESAHLTAAAGGMSSAALTFNISPATPTKLAISGPMTGLQSGVCSPAYTIAVQDTFGNTAPVPAATSITFSSSGQVGFYSDASCTNSVSSLSLAAGQSSSIVYFDDNAAQALTVTAASPPLTQATLSLTFQPAPPVKIVLSGPHQATTGQCAGPFTTASEDAHGNLSPVASPALVTMSGLGSGNVYTDSTCSVTESGPTIASGTSSAQFYFLDPTSEILTLSATAPGLTSSTLALTIQSGVPAKLKITGPLSVASAQCSSAFTVTALDAYGNATNVSSSTVVALSGGGAGLFYSNSICSATAFNLSIPAGSSSQTFYFRDGAAESLVFSATTSGLTAGTLSVVVNGGSPTKLALAGPSSMLTTAACSAAFSVTTEDSTGNPAAVPSNTFIALSGNGLGSFYSDPSCLIPASNGVTIGGGTTNATFFFKDTSVQSLTFSASAGGALTPASLPFSVIAGSPSKLALSGATSIASGSCAAYTVTTEDANGNTSAVSQTTVITLSGGAGTFFSDPACSSSLTAVQISAGNSSQAFYFRDTTAQSAFLSATATGFTSGSLAVTVQANAAVQLAFSGPTNMTAGSCIAVAVTSEDVYDNAAPLSSGASVGLSGAGSGAFYSDSGCSHSVTSAFIPPGGSSATFYFSDPTVGQVTLNGTVSGLTNASLAVTVKAASGTKLQLSGATSIAAGACGSYSVTAVDLYGNPTPVSSSLPLTISGLGSGAIFSDSACSSPAGSTTIASGTASYSFYFKDTKAESLVVSTVASGYSSGSLSMTVTPLSPSRLTLTGAASVSAGTCNAYTLLTSDLYANNSPVATNLAVALSGAGSGAFYTDSQCTNTTSSTTIAAGASASVFYFRTISAGSATLQASAAGLSSASIGVTVQSGGVSSLALSGSASIQVPNCVGYTVSAEDAYGNAVAVGSSVTATLSGASHGAYYANSACTQTESSVTIPSGSSSSTLYFKDLTAESVTLSALSAGLGAGTLAVTVSPAAPSALGLAGPSVLNAGTCGSYVLSAQDAYGNASPTSSALAVVFSGTEGGSFYSDPSCTSAIASLSIPASSSQVTVYFSDTTAQSLTLTASSSGLTPGTAALTVQSGAASAIGITGSSSITAGVCTAYTVAALDAHGNNVTVTSQANVTLTATGSGSFFSDSGCAHATSTSAIVAGASSVTVYFRDAVAQSVTLGAASTGLTSGSLGLTVSANSPSQIALIGPGTDTAGICSVAYKATSTDQFGNPVNVSSATQVNLSGQGHGTFYSDSTCSTAVTSVTIASGTSGQNFYFKDTVAEPLTFSGSGSLTTGTLSVTVNPASASQITLSGPATDTAGNCSAAYTATIKDQYGNSSPVSSATQVSLTGQAHGTFYSDSTCSTPVTSVTVAQGTSTQSFYFKDTTVESTTFLGSGSLATGTLTVTVVSLGSPTQLVFSGPAAPTAGLCSAAYVVTSEDQYGNGVDVSSATQVTLSGNGHGAFYSDSTCSTAVTSITIAQGTDNQSFYFKDTSAESLTFSGSSSLSAGALNVTVNAALPTQFALSGPAADTAGTCSAAYTATSEDQYGNASSVSSATQVTLSGAGHGAFYSDSGCATAVTSVTIAQGTSNQVFYFKDTTAESLTFQGSGTLTSGALAVNVVSPGSPSQIAFSGPGSDTVGACSSAYTTTSEDQYGNPVAVSSPTQVTLSGNGHGAFYSDSGCTTPATSITIFSGSSSQTFYFKDGTAETLTFSGTSSLTAGSLPVTVNPAAASQIALSGQATDTVGACSAAYTVTSEDQFGNAVNLSSPLQVTLSGNGHGAFYSDSGCATVATSVTIASGANHQVFYFKDSQVESLIFSGSGALGSTTLPIAVDPAPPNQFAMSGPASLTVGSCSAAYTVTSQDQYGNASNVSSATQVTLSGADQGIFYSNSGCSSPITSVTISAGSNSQVFYFKDTTAESLTLSGSGSLATANLPVSIKGAAASQLALSGPAADTVGTCSPAYTVTSEDQFGNPVTVSSPTQVSLSGNGHGAFYSDSGCATAVTSVTIASGSDSQVFYFKDMQVESLIFSGSGSLTTGTLTVAINPASANQFVLSGPASVTVGACSAAYAVTSEDQFGNPSNVSSATQVTLTGQGHGTFYSNSGCSSPITSLTIAQGSNSQLFYFKDTTAESLTFSGTGSLATGTMGVTVNAASASQLAMSGPVSGTAGACTAAYTVTSEDQYGNAVTLTSSTQVRLSGNGHGAFFSDSGCSSSIPSVTIPSGSNSQSFYFKDTTAEALTLLGSSSIASGTLGVSIAPSSASQFVLSGPTTGTAGVCSAAYTVTSEDQYGNAVNVSSATQVTLSGAGHGAFYSDAACATPVTSAIIASGANGQAFYFKDTTAESLTFSGSGSLSAGTLNVVVNSSSPTRFALSGPATTTAGACSAAYSVTSQDQFGNSVSVASATQVTLSGNGHGAFYSDSGCSTAISSVTLLSGTSNMAFYFKDSSAEALTFSGSGSLATGSMTVTVNPASASQLVLTGPTTATVGDCSPAYVVTSEDQYGNAVTSSSNNQVTLSGAGRGAFYSDSGCSTAVTSITIAQGSSNQAFYFKDTTAESLTFSASGSLTAGALAVTVNASSANQFALSGPTTLTAGACSAGYTVTSEDQYGNAVNVSSATQVTLSGGGHGTFYSDSGCATAITSVTIASGSSGKTFYLKDVTAESLTLSASGTLTAGTLTATVNPAAVSQFALSGPATVTAGSCSAAYTVTSQDQYGNPVNVSSATQVTLSGAGSGAFYSDSSCGTAVTSVTIAQGSNNKTFYFKDAATESLTFSASGSLSTGNLAVTVVSTGAPTQFALSGPATVTAGSCSAAYTVTSQDQFGNAKNVSSPTQVNLSGQGHGAYYSDSGCTAAVASVTIASGSTSKSFYFKDTAAESLTFSATGSLTTGTLGVTVNTASASQFALTGPAADTVNTCSSAYTVTSQDQYGNAVKGSSATQVTLAGNGHGAFYSDSTCSTSVTSVTIAQGASSQAFYFKDTTVESLSFSGSGSLTTGTLAVTINAANVSQFALTGAATNAAGTCSAAYTVTSEDQYGNPVNVSTAAQVTLSGNGHGTFYSNSGCSTAITSVTIASGTSSQLFYFKDTTAEALTFSGSGSLATGTLAVTINAASATKFVLSGPATDTAGTCSAAYTVTSADQYGNAANVASATQVSFTGNGHGTFYSDSGCSSALSSVTIASGSNNKVFYFKDTTAEALTLSGSGSLSTGTLAVTVSTASATQFVLSGPTSDSAGVCSAAYTVTSEDQYGNAVNVSSAAQVTLSGNTHGAFYSDSACSTSISNVTIASGSSSKTFYFKDTTAESLTFSGAGSLTTGTLAITVGAASASKLALSGASNIVAGTCNQYTFTSEDTYGNVSAVSSSLTIQPTGQGAGGFYSDSGCSSSITSVALTAGTSTKTLYFKDTATQTLTLSVDDTGTTLVAGTELVSVGAAAATDLMLVGSQSPSGGACVTYTITSEDQYGNPSTVSSNTTIALSGQGLGSFYSDSGCSTSTTAVSLAAGTSTRNFYFKDTTAESLTFSASTGGVLSTGSLVVSVQAAAPSAFALSGPATDTAGTCSAAYTATSEDQYGNASNVSSATQVTLSGNGHGAFYSDSACSTLVTSVTIASGSNSKTFYFKDTTTESLTFSGAGSLTTGTLSVTVRAASASKLALSGPASVTAGSCSTAYTLTSEDQFGNAVPLTSTLTINLGGGGSGSFYAASGCSGSAVTSVTMSSGSSTQSFYFLDTTAESLTLKGQDSGQTLSAGTLPVTITAGAVSASHSIVSASPTAVIASGSVSSTITVTLNDANNNPVFGKTVTLSQESGSSVITPSSATTNSSGQCAFTVTDTTAQTVTYTAADSTDSVTVTTTASVTFTSTNAVLSFGETSYNFGFVSPDPSPAPTHVITVTNTTGIGGSSATSVTLSGLSGALSETDNCSGHTIAPQGTCSITVTYSPNVAGATNQTLTLSYNNGSSSTNTTDSISGEGASLIAANNSGSFTCALSTAGNVYCWGSNSNGQLGNNNTNDQHTPVEVEGVGGSGFLSSIASLAAGGNHTCALSSAGNVYCWGSNSNGQLGNNNINDQHTPVEVEGVGGSGYLSGIVSLTAGQYHTCALSSAGNVYCWGNDSNGQLGNNSTRDNYTPVEVDGVGGSGYLSSIIALTAGQSFTCALSSAGNAYCWGDGRNGQLGNGASGPHGSSNTAVEVVGVGGRGNLSSVVGLSSGQNHTCALASSGNVYCWGQNGNGQLGNNSTSQQTTPVEVEGTGGSGYLSNIESLASGGNSSCALNSAGDVYCWGSGGSGQLGNNNINDEHTPVGVEGVGGSGFLSGIVSLTAGQSHACALSSGGNVYCWGYNANGQLGNNSITEENTPVEVEGPGGSGNLSGI